MVLEIFCIAYAGVFLSEVIGDRSLLAVSCLSARHGIRAVLLGATPAFMFKAFVATAFGTALSHLPHRVISGLTAATFVTAAFTFARINGRDMNDSDATRSAWHGALYAFGTIFFSEWADVGQITTAAMVARFGHPAIVWLAASGALVTKASAGSFIGSRFGAHIQLWQLRWGAVVAFLLMAVLALLPVDGP